MDIEIYCDESRPDLFTSQAAEKDQYLLIGSLWLPADKREVVKRDIWDIKEKYNVGTQIKWQKISPSRLEFYLSLIDLFFKYGETVRFRCILIDAGKIDFARIKNDPELGFYKFYYQLLQHWISDQNRYRIFCDTKTNRSPDRLRTLQHCLSATNLEAEIVSIQSIPSKESAIIQFADLLLGATSSYVNKTLRPGSAKAAVVDKLAQSLGRKLFPTSKVEKKYNIFEIRLQEGW